MVKRAQPVIPADLPPGVYRIKRSMTLDELVAYLEECAAAARNQKLVGPVADKSM